MGDELLEIGVQIRKFVTFSVRTCYRSVCNHPFLVGLVFFFIFLYRSFPFLFSLLVSASPVIVCTAVLLGTLLSFGKPNIPEIEKEVKRTHEILSLKTGVSIDATVVERDESFGVERYTEKGRDVEEKSIEGASGTASKVGEVEEDDNSLVGDASLINQNSREIQFEKLVSEEAERELDDWGFEKKCEMEEEKRDDGKVVENQHSPSQKVENENVEVDHDKLQVEFVDSRMADNLLYSPISPWKKVVGEEEADVDEEASDSGSDRAESSSPDASMADIIPMLDELHPLLDEDAPHPAPLSHDGSDAASERSPKSSDGINESDEDIENQEEDDEEEEETLGGKEDGTKSAITWTADDQKNLMDLGTSELERNQRLESLIARRRARKNLRMMTEKNLIDFESSDLPFNIAPISTRRNPFDLPYNSNDNMGLPPIPGSAPSILLPRRNPFDLPYDSSEEKPDLMRESFQQEFMSFHPKETFFRRHESFNVGPSFFGPPKLENQDIKLRPYFVPEGMALEGTIYSSFQRQSSELSESKVSSIPEMESMCSAGDQEDKKLIEEDFSREEELPTNTDHVSERVKHGSESSKDLDFVEAGQVENQDIELNEIEIKLGDLENRHEMESGLSETRGVAAPAEHNPGEIHLNIRAVEESHKSSSSSLSEINENIIDEKEDEGLSSLGSREGNLIEESGISMQPSAEELDFNITSELVDENQCKEPVYDSSPIAVEKNFSSSSVSSDPQVETSEMGLPPVLVKRTVSFADRESEMSNQSIEKDTPGNDKLAGSSQLHAVEENELGPGTVKEISEDDVLNFGLSRVEQNVDIANTSMAPEFVVSHASINSNLSSDSESVDKKMLYWDESHQREHDQVPLTCFDKDMHVEVQKDVGEKVDSAAFSSQFKSSGDLNLATPEEEHPLFVVEQVSGIHPETSSDTESIEEHSFSKEAALQFEQDQVHLSSSDANFHFGIHQEADEKLVSTNYQYVIEEKSMLELEKQLPLSDKSMVEFSFDNYEELQEPSIIQGESIEEVSGTGNLNVSEDHEPNNHVSANICPPSTPNHVSFPSKVFETKSSTCIVNLKGTILDGNENEEQIQVLEHFNHPAEAIGSQVDEQNIIEEVDEIKEIDEGLLLELDTVGDFSVVELGSNLNEIEKHLILGGESFLVPHDLGTESSGAVKGESIEVDGIKDFVDPDNPRASSADDDIDQNREVAEASEFQTSETSYTLHIDSSVREFVHGEVENPMDLKSINKESLQRETEVELELADSMINQNLIAEEINSEMPIVEAQSIEDINSIFKKTGPVKTEVVELGESEIPHQDQIKVEINYGMPVLEARSLEDIDSAFKQIGGEEIKIPFVIKSLHTELTPEEAKAGCSEYGMVHRDSNLKQTNLELPVLEAKSVEDIDLAFKQLERGIFPSSVDERPDVVESKDHTEMYSNLHHVEARSLEDIDMALKQVSVGNLEKLLKLDSEDGSAQIEANEVGSSKEIESRIKEFGAPETSTSAAENPKNEVQTSENLSLSMSDVERKKAQSHKSSSSSSSSSSDSDRE